jgi:hypothetical protein
MYHRHKCKCKCKNYTSNRLSLFPSKFLPFFQSFFQPKSHTSSLLLRRWSVASSIGPNWVDSTARESSLRIDVFQIKDRRWLMARFIICSYSTQNYWVYRIRLSSGILNTRKKSFGVWICFRSKVKRGWHIIHLLSPLERANLKHWTTHVEVEVEATLQLTVSKSVCRAVELTLGLVTRYYFLSEGCCLKVEGLVSVRRPLWREDRSAIAVQSLNGRSRTEPLTIL